METTRARPVPFLWALWELPSRAVRTLRARRVTPLRFLAATLLLAVAVGDHVTTKGVLTSGAGREGNPGVVKLMELLGVDGALTFGSALCALLALMLLAVPQNRSERVLQYATLPLIPAKLLATVSNALIWMNG